MKRREKIEIDIVYSSEVEKGGLKKNLYLLRI